MSCEAEEARPRKDSAAVAPASPVNVLQAMLPTEAGAPTVRVEEPGLYFNREELAFASFAAIRVMVVMALDTKVRVSASTRYLSAVAAVVVILSCEAEEARPRKDSAAVAPVSPVNNLLAMLPDEEPFPTVSVALPGLYFNWVPALTFAHLSAVVETVPIDPLRAVALLNATQASSVASNDVIFIVEPLPAGPVAPMGPPEGPVAPTSPVAPIGPFAPVAPVGPSTPAPVAPVTPAGPIGPVAPVGPEGPVAPVGPSTPAPVAPVGPSRPATPVAPVGPATPAPVAPVGPLRPATPVAPVGPATPVAPPEPPKITPIV